MTLQPTDAHFLLRLMSATTLRHEVLAGNIANQNTPGYKRRDVEFESLVLRELERSSPRVDRVEPRVVVDTKSSSRPDGNNVTMELEQSGLRENRLMFELFAALLEGRSQLLHSAMGGR